MKEDLIHCNSCTFAYDYRLYAEVLIDDAKLVAAVTETIRRVYTGTQKRRLLQGELNGS